MPTALDVADWVIPRWSGTRDRVIAVSLGIGGARAFNDPIGIWGVGGKPGDGPSQADAALAVWAANGWTPFPARKNGSAALFWPIAAAAVAERAVQQPAAAAATAAATSASAVSDVPDAIKGAFDKLTNGLAIVTWLTTPNAWVRITKVVAGIGLVFIGSGMISLSTISAPFMNLLGKADDTAAAQAGLVSGRNP